MTTQELVTHLYAEAMKLPEKERLQLVMSLSETMGPGVSDDEGDHDEGPVTLAEPLMVEVARRADAFQAGSKGIPLDEARVAAFEALRRS